ncbi:hypothetical protein BpHYR1_029030 [Brachionus plicatilis]|uniref:Uncharacterized protein n=1 Tax=Brachionus plicatilis TaxID=10195 RepID=A0A3M7SWJ9_BRAPC|nr:hypothetical protein BpHYR1_029030 [Brachionus plicatilis]
MQNFEQTLTSFIFIGAQVIHLRFYQNSSTILDVMLQNLKITAAKSAIVINFICQLNHPYNFLVSIFDRNTKIPNIKQDQDLSEVVFLSYFKYKKINSNNRQNII